MSNMERRNKWENKIIKKKCINKDGSTHRSYNKNVNYLLLRRTRKSHGRSSNSASKQINAGSKCYYRNLHRKKDMQLSQFMCNSYSKQYKDTIDIDEYIDDQIIISEWTCNRCTFDNVNGTNKCEMCQNPAPRIYYDTNRLKCNNCFYITTVNSTNCDVCGTLHSNDVTNTLLNTIEFTSKPKTKHHRSRRKKKKNGNDNNTFEQYWNTIKQSKNEYEISQLKQEKRQQKFMLAKGKMTKLMKLIVHIYLQQKSYYRNEWTDIHNPTVAFNAEQFLLNKQIPLTDRFRLNMIYLLQNETTFNHVLIKLGNKTYDRLVSEKLLAKAINYMKNISVTDVSDANLEEYFNQKKNSIWKYIENESKKEPVCTESFHHSLRFDIVMTLHAATEYEYLYNNIPMLYKSKHQPALWGRQKFAKGILSNIPMKLKNFTFDQCVIGIHDNVGNTDKSYNFFSDGVDVYIPMYSCLYESVYKAYQYPAIYSKLQNAKLKDILSQCICRIGQFPMMKLLNNLKFDKCHEPYYNVLPLSFRLSRILVEYIPVRHILRYVLIPFLGYNTMHYIVMSSEIKYKSEEENIIYNYEFYDNECKEWMLRECVMLKRNEPVVIENSFGGNRDIVLLKVDGHEYVDDDVTIYGSSDGSSIFIDLFGSDSDDEY